MNTTRDRTDSRTVGASTLGAPGEELSTVLDWLAAAGARTVELRVAEGETVHARCGPRRRAEVRTQIAESGIELLSCSSYVRLGADETDEAVIADLTAHLTLAADLGARFLRVFPGAGTHPGPGDRPPIPVVGQAEADARIVRRLARVTGLAEALGVRPALETHGSHPRGEDIARLLGALDAVAAGHTVGVIWDVEHPYRTGEAPERTWSLIGQRVLRGRGFVQMKDVGSTRDQTPVLVGHGVVPLGTIVGLLDESGYTGPLSLEWERTWHPEVAPLPVALESLNHWLRLHPRSLEHDDPENGESWAIGPTGEPTTPPIPRLGAPTT